MATTVADGGGGRAGGMAGGRREGKEKGSCLLGPHDMLNETRADITVTLEQIVEMLSRSLKISDLENFILNEGSGKMQR